MSPTIAARVDLAVRRRMKKAVDPAGPFGMVIGRRHRPAEIVGTAVALLTADQADETAPRETAASVGATRVRRIGIRSETAALKVRDLRGAKRAREAVLSVAPG